MAVYEYHEGDLKSGFCGFRVCRSLGSVKEIRQKYFSFKKYEYDEARDLAYKTDSEWAQEAKKIVSHRNISETRYAEPRSKGVVAKRSFTIAKGFRAYIGVEKRTVNGIVIPYIFPAFIVKKPGRSNQYKTFRIKTLGFDRAFSMARAYYCEGHSLDPSDMLSLEARKPDKSVFLDSLYLGLKDKGISVTKRQIKSTLTPDD